MAGFPGKEKLCKFEKNNSQNSMGSWLLMATERVPPAVSPLWLGLPRSTEAKEGASLVLSLGILWCLGSQRTWSFTLLWVFQGSWQNWMPSLWVPPLRGEELSPLGSRHGAGQPALHGAFHLKTHSQATIYLADGIFPILSTRKKGKTNKQKNRGKGAGERWRQSSTALRHLGPPSSRYEFWRQGSSWMVVWLVTPPVTSALLVDTWVSNLGLKSYSKVYLKVSQMWKQLQKNKQTTTKHTHTKGHPLRGILGSQNQDKIQITHFLILYV